MIKLPPPSSHDHPQQLHAQEVWLSPMLILCMLVVALLAASNLPAPVPAHAPPEVFSEARARTYLDQILAIGPFRTVGSRYNEVDTPLLLENVLHQIRNQSRLGGEHVLQWQRQTGSGNFSLDFLGGFHNVYHQVTNVLVLMRGQRPPASGIVMVSAHYDSAVGVPGASDNAANVAILVEIIRAIAARPELPPYGLLFVFNGAEETILQGSHSLVHSGHPWTRHIRAFINLEAAGASGREMMFQAGEGMAEVWARGVPHPHGSVVGQDVFQSGVIPSDTDFRIYVDFDAPGLDMANVDNGQVYHTKLDNAEHIFPGAIQRYGENVLGMIQAIDALPLRARNSPVFFDVFGLMVVRLSPGMCMLLLLAGAAVLGAFFRKARPLVELGLGVKNLGAALAGAVGLPLSTALVLAWLAPLSYYSNLGLAGLLYVAPAAHGLIANIARFPHASQAAKDKSPRPAGELSAFCAAVGMWAAFTLVLVHFRKGSAYISWAWAVLPVAARLVAGGDVRGKRAALVAATAGVAVPLALTVPPLLVVFRIFLPITGRSGTVVPGDVIVALICSVATFLTLIVPGSLLHLVPKPVVARVLKVLRVLWLAGVAWALLRQWFGSGGYSHKFPKRVYAVHVERLEAGREQPESFLWVIGADASGLGRVLSRIEGAAMVDCRTDPRVYCGLPWYLPMMKEIPKSAVIATSPLLPDPEACAMQRVAETRTSDGLRRVHVKLTRVTDHINVYFRDEQHGGPVRWSFGDGPLPAHNGHVFVSFAAGKVPEAGYEFWLDVKDKLDVAWACHYLEEPMGPDPAKLMSLLPEPWIDVISFVSRYRSVVF